jgi:CMP/dCMP kinase
MSEERLQKVLAAAGIGSRRACEELITAGRVTVDGHVVSELGAKVDPERAAIRVDGRPIAAEHFRYIMLHKPAGYLSNPDPRAGYPDWQELVKVPERLYAVGRLDVDSEGLLLLTNDGGLANRLTHPRYEHPKTYLVQVEGFPDSRKVRRMRHGVMLDDGPTAPAQVELLHEPPPEAEQGRKKAEEQRRRRAGVEPKAAMRGPAAAPGPSGGTASPPAGHARRPRPSNWLKVTLREGRKRQLRRMVSLLGHPALRVIRIGLGPLTLAELRTGKWRDLSAGEVRALRALVPAESAGRRSTANLDRTGQTGPRNERKSRPLPSTIAIDGPAASGKSTIGGRLANELDYLYFDTGVMYRAITCVALAQSVPISNEDAVGQLAEEVQLEVHSPTVDDGRDVTVLADGQDITPNLRRPEVDRAVSPVSAYRRVRDALTLQQRRIGQAGRVVMVGRDIGTVVMPRADLKIYLDASLRERAHRRYLECTARGQQTTEDEVAEQLRRRDQFDSSRQHAPLSVAPDAIVVDSTSLTIVQVMEQMRVLLKRWGERKK